jgi:hypothetical protein
MSRIEFSQAPLIAQMTFLAIENRIRNQNGRGVGVESTA